MLRKDFLQRQIEELGKFIRLIMEKIWKKNAGSDEIEAEMAALNAEFTENCGFDIYLLATSNIDLLLEKIKYNDTYNHENVDLLADFMCELADRYPTSALATQAILKANALKLYRFSDQTFRIYSYERQLKMDNLKEFEFEE